MQSENKDATGTGGTPLKTYLSGIINSTKTCLFEEEEDTIIVYTKSEWCLSLFIKYLIIGATLVLLNTFAFAQTLEEVTVTAARKEQSVQDVAISVQAITSEDLELQHIDTADDLASTVPGFDFSEGLGSGVVLKIRGLQLVTIGSAGTSPAITAQNGHQVGNRPFSTIGFYDADRIEILEGPQGTLYGRNSTTGLINFITAKPGAEQYLALTAGADGLAQLKFARDFELSDTAVMRIAATKYDSDGVIYNAGTGNDIDDRDSFGVRATMEFEMDDQNTCLLYTSPSPRDATLSRMPSSA